MPAKRMTPFASICPDATTWYLVIIGLLLLTGTGQAQVVPMVKQMPFPYSVGIAADTATYARIRAKIQAADQVVRTAETRIQSLTAEIAGLNGALLDQQRLSRYDSVQAIDNQALLDLANRQLKQAVIDRDAGFAALQNLLKPLPKRLRKILANAPPDVLATAILDYISRQQHRKWSWSGAAILTGFFLGLFAASR